MIETIRDAVNGAIALGPVTISAAVLIGCVSIATAVHRLAKAVERLADRR